MIDLGANVTESQSQRTSGGNSAFRPLRGILVIVLAVTAVVGISKWNQPKEIIPWRTDWNKAVAEAQAAKKPVFAYLTADWCGPCQELKHTIWADPKVEAALKNYVPVKVDIDQNAELARRYLARDDGIPAFFLIDNDGRTLRESHGAMTSEEILAWLKG